MALPRSNYHSTPAAIRLYARTLRHQLRTPPPPDALAKLHHAERPVKEDLEFGLAPAPAFYGARFINAHTVVLSSISRLTVPLQTLQAAGSSS